MKIEPIKLTFKSGSLWYGEYEVVNPEVIPITPDGYSTRIKDGDQITLPDGYGIEKHYQPDSGPLVRRVSIILPEKPENSAHGCPKCRTTDFNSCHSMYCPMRKESVVEPSESQEETYKAMLGKQISYRYVDWEEGSFSPWQTCTEKHLKTVFQDASIDVIQFKP